MSANNKEILDNASSKMKERYKEREEDLSLSWKIPEEIIWQYRKSVFENFYKKVDSLKEEPWYEDALKSARKEGYSRYKLKKTQMIKNKLLREQELLKQALENVDADIYDKKKSFEAAQIAHRWKVEIDQDLIGSLKQIEDPDAKREKILDYLITKCLDKKEHVKEYWEEWTHYCLTLPSVKWSEWNWFKWKKIDWFESSYGSNKDGFVTNIKGMFYSSSSRGVSKKIFWNLRDFLAALGVPDDVNKNFAKELFKGCSCYTQDVLKNATGTGLKRSYWLRDVKWGSRAIFISNSDEFIITWDGNEVNRYHHYWYLLQWLKVTELW